MVKEWVMDSEVEEPSIGGACSAMIHRFKCIPGWVRLVEAGIGSAGILTVRKVKFFRGIFFELD